MGFFSNLFEKKNCVFCGKEIGLLGNHKLADGNMCGDCADKLSPFLSGTKKMTVADIQAHMDYREANYNMLQQFRETRVVGNYMKIHIDDNQGLLFFSTSSNWRTENPDLLRFDQITGVNVRVDQHQHTVTPPPQPGPGGPGGPGMHGGPQQGRPMQGGPGMHGGPQPGRPMPGGPGMHGGPQPGRPMPGGPGMHGGPGMPPPAPMVEYEYDFNAVVNVNSPWFTEITWRINRSTVHDMNSPQYQNASMEANQITSVLQSLQNMGMQYNNQYQYTVVCPFCNATVVPNPDGSCSNCGGNLNR